MPPLLGRFGAAGEGAPAVDRVAGRCPGLRKARRTGQTFARQQAPEQSSGHGFVSCNDRSDRGVRDAELLSLADEAGRDPAPSETIMTTSSRPVVASAAERSRDGWDDPVHGRVSWFTLFSRDITPTDSLSAGITEIEPGSGLNAHRHTQPEIYFLVEGSGIVMVDGSETAVSAGASVFIPGDALHGIRNASHALLRFFYCFPADSFSEVVYRFPDGSPAPDLPEKTLPET